MSDKLPSGRERDALIAERVFGWYWSTIALYSHEKRVLRQSMKVAGVIERKDGDTIYLASLPKYSTDMGAAWKVVDRLNALGYWCQMEQCERGWCVTFKRRDSVIHEDGYGDDGDAVYRVGEQIADTISRAALAIPAPQSTAP